MAVPLSNTPLLAQEPLQESWLGHPSPLPTTGAYRSVTCFAEEKQDSRLRLSPPSSLVRSPSPEPCPRTPTANPLPLIVRCSLQIPSLRGPRIPPSLSAPWLPKPPALLRDVRSAPAFKVSTPILSGGHSFGRGSALSPGTP